MSEGATGWEEETPERLYVITGGRSGATGPDTLDLVTLIVSKAKPKPGAQPEHAAILRMCHAPLSVAEISAYLRLPISVVTVLLGDLVTGGKVVVRAPVAQAQLPDRALIEAVIHGLQKL
jgi:Protein of unknown function (DUF742)